MMAKGGSENQNHLFQSPSNRQYPDGTTPRRARPHLEKRTKDNYQVHTNHFQLPANRLASNRRFPEDRFKNDSQKKNEKEG